MELELKDPETCLKFFICSLMALKEKLFFPMSYRVKPVSNAILRARPVGSGLCEVSGVGVIFSMVQLSLAST